MNISSILQDRAVALCDCNNFFVSCERKRNPHLCGVPVVVLSSNDGCIVSRSNEAKQLKIPMGAPLFKFKAFFEAHGVKMCSGDLRFYSDVSRSVMSVLSEFTDNLQQYSIDEAFFNMAILTVKDPVAYCAHIRAEILSRCAIPVSIGISPNKTLSKLASEYAKKHEETGGVFWFDRAHYTDENFMSHFELGNVWGIGRKNENKLRAVGIDTVLKLRQADSKLIKERFGQPMLITQWALQGKPAEHKSHSKTDAPKSIQVSRSFGKRVSDYETLLDAINNFVVAAARQLREAHTGAAFLRIYLRTGGYYERKYFEAHRKFKNPLYLDSELMKVAKSLLDEIYVAGAEYTKAGVDIPLLSTAAECNQALLFDNTQMQKPQRSEKMTRAEAAADEINKTLGISSMKPAELFSNEKLQGWRPKTAHGETQKDKKLQDKRGQRFASHAEDV